MCLLMSIHGPHTYSLDGLTHEISGDYFLASGFDHPEWPILALGGSGGIERAAWGLVPSWIKSTDEARKIRNQTLNARGETIFVKASFRTAARSGRCLVFVDGFIEPHKHGGISFPFYCSFEDGSLMVIAGLVSTWRDPENGGEARTFTIVTTEANELMSRVHNEKRRMPVILAEQSDQKRWLDPQLTSERAQALLATRDIPLLSAYPVSRAIYARTGVNNLPEARERVDYPELRGAP